MSTILTAKTSIRSLIGLFVGLLGLLVSGLFLIPFNPKMPAIGLDASWQYALNEALAKHYIFGKDIIFTFGPLGPIYTRMFGPATDGLMMSGSLVYAIGFCAALGALGWHRRGIVLVLLPVAIAACSLLDSIFISLPFILFVQIIRFQKIEEFGGQFKYKSKFFAYASIVAATIAAAMGPIIKGSFAGAALVPCLSIFIVLLIRRQYVASLCFSALFATSLIASWLLAGQPLSALFDFFLAQRPIISGYTDAMSLSASLKSVIVYLIASVTLLWMTYFSLSGANRAIALLLMANLLWILFVGFKAGFVRQDGHVLIAGGVLLLLGLVLALIMPARPAAITALVAFLAWFIVVRSVLPVTFFYPLTQFSDAWRSTVDGVVLRLKQPDHLLQAYRVAVEKIRAQAPLPHVEGGVDIYPDELSAIFANNLRWSGRPVFQSYSAYTTELQQKNADYLLGSSAPDTVFFSFSPIDGHLPSAEDSRSLLVLFDKYKIVEYAGNYIRMDRDPGANGAHLMAEQAHEVEAEWGKDVPLNQGVPLWATIDARPSLIGRMLQAIFKLPQLEIDLKFPGGLTVSHRYIGNVGRGGFIISPYLRSNEDLVDFTSGALSPPRPESFKLVTHWPVFWEPIIRVQLTPINISPEPSAKTLVVTPWAADPPTALLKKGWPTTQHCTIDAVNNEPYRSSTVHRTATGLLVLQGWASPVEGADSATTSTWISVSGNAGMHYLKAVTQQRPDVAAAFNRPLLSSSGFRAVLDLGEDSGKQSIKVFSVSNNTAYNCGITVEVY